ncbi:hypothetical protein [Streptomyces sp. NPDC052042]|uniref:hypothetical protein n=1 Tax=Streptomyces sp. NPDC052042 TaxID=3365683 RepID=UPI0037D97FE3
MIGTAVLLGIGITLAGLVLTTDYRGAAQWFVDTQLNPVFAEPSVLRRLDRLGKEHPSMDFSLRRPRLRVLVRIWGGVVALIGFGFVAMAVVHLVRSWLS